MKKLTDHQRRMIALGAGISMVLYGVVQAVFKLEFLDKHKAIIDEIFFIVMLVAAMLLFSNIRKAKQEPAEPKKTTTEETKSEEIEGK